MCTRGFDAATIATVAVQCHVSMEQGMDKNSYYYFVDSYSYGYVANQTRQRTSQQVQPKEFRKNSGEVCLWCTLVGVRRENIALSILEPLELCREQAGQA